MSVSRQSSQNAADRRLTYVLCPLDVYTCPAIARPGSGCGPPCQPYCFANHHPRREHSTEVHTIIRVSTRERDEKLIARQLVPVTADRQLRTLRVVLRRKQLDHDDLVPNQVLPGFQPLGNLDRPVSPLAIVSHSHSRPSIQLPHFFITALAKGETHHPSFANVC